jgi:4-amino-4-deoxy-L-arabinose transferase-like glycosyltransferase
MDWMGLLPRLSLSNGRYPMFGWLVVAIMAVLGFVIELALTAPRGPGMSTDSVNYLAAADSLARGDGFLTFTGQPFVSFAPLYPVVLAAPKVVLEADPIATARILSGLASAGTILLTALLFWECMPSSRWWGILAGLSVLLSASFLVLYANALSDPLFIVLVLLFLLAARRYIEHRSKKVLLLLGLLGALAALVRYAGLPLILVGSLIILFAYPATPVKKALAAAIFTVLSAAPLAVWIVRNSLLVGLPFGFRDPSEWAPLDTASDLTIKASRWFLPFGLPLAFSALLIVVVLAAALLWPTPSNLIKRARSIMAAQPILAPALAFMVLYSLGLLLTVEAVEHIGIAYDDRYYLPLYVPLLLLICLGVRAGVHRRVRPTSAITAETVLLAGFAIWLLYPAFGGARLVRRALARGWVPFYNIYQTPAFLDSDVARWLAEGEASTDEPLFSNQPAAAYLALREPVEPSPINRNASGISIPLQAYCGLWPPEEGAVLIWYAPKRDTAFSLEELATLAELQPVQTTEHSGIYLARRR